MLDFESQTKQSEAPQNIRDAAVNLLCLLCFIGRRFGLMFSRESAEGDDDVEVPIPPKTARDADGKLLANAKVRGGDERTHAKPTNANGASRTTDVFVPARMIDRLEAAAPVAAFFVGIVRSSCFREQRIWR